jgi:hypothetical protein
MGKSLILDSMGKSWILDSLTYIARKLANTNGNTDRIFLSVDCNELYLQNILSLYPLVNTDINGLSLYTKRITVEK